MAFIGESRQSSEHPWHLYLCLDCKECELLMKAVGSLEGRCLRTLEYYKGKLEGGEATEKDTDKLLRAEEDYETILSIRKNILMLKGGKK